MASENTIEPKRCDGCGYALAGLPVHADGSVVCPECGREARQTGDRQFQGRLVLIAIAPCLVGVPLATWLLLIMPMSLRPFLVPYLYVLAIAVFGWPFMVNAAVSNRVARMNGEGLACAIFFNFVWTSLSTVGAFVVFAFTFGFD